MRMEESVDGSRSRPRGSRLRARPLGSREGSDAPSFAPSGRVLMDELDVDLMALELVETGRVVAFRTLTPEEIQRVWRRFFELVPEDDE